MRTIILPAIAAIACLGLFSDAAWAERQQYRYTCFSGGLAVTSSKPCYATTVGISVPGSGISGISGLGNNFNNNKDPQGNNAVNGGGNGVGGIKGGGINGPKDFSAGPKGLGDIKDFNNKN